MSGNRFSYQVRRAWVILLAGFALFAALFVFAISSAYSYVREGTQTHTSVVEPVSGSSLLIRSEHQQDWRLVTERTSVEEGDYISTGSGTVGWVTLFDQGTVEISENSVIQVNRMRTSRLFQDQKEIEIEPIRGSVYVGMAPRGEYNSSVFRVRSGPATIRMRDEIRSDETGSFLVETQRLDPTGDQDVPILSVRVAVLRGVATVESERGDRRLVANEQVVLDSDGKFGERTTAMRELIRNGSFDRQLSDWVEYQENPGNSPGNAGTIERVQTDESDSGVALQISRATDLGDNWETGIQQTIGQSLRVHSSLQLSMDVRVEEQYPPGGGDELTEFPMIARIEYVDVQGHEREWWHGFYIMSNPGNPVTSDRATRIPRGEWTAANLDLGDLEPLPWHVSSLTFYASGHNYRTLVTNISLTSSELGDEQYD